jgi:hypothetical protein
MHVHIRQDFPPVDQHKEIRTELFEEPPMRASRATQSRADVFRVTLSSIRDLIGIGCWDVEKVRGVR